MPAGDYVRYVPHLFKNYRPGSRTPSLPDLLRALAAHKKLFNNIDEHPEGDVRHRFGHARAIRARYIEFYVRGQERAWDELEDEVTRNKINANDPETIERFENVMIGLDKGLQWISRVWDEDSKAASAPAVGQHMDSVYRIDLLPYAQGQLAPNAELRDIYGKVGDPVSSSLMALRGSDDSLIHNFITRILVARLEDYVAKPLVRGWDRLLRRAPRSRRAGLRGGTVDNLVDLIECTIIPKSNAHSDSYNWDLGGLLSDHFPFRGNMCPPPFSDVPREQNAAFGNIYQRLVPWRDVVFQYEKPSYRGYALLERLPDSMHSGLAKLAPMHWHGHGAQKPNDENGSDNGSDNGSSREQQSQIDAERNSKGLWGKIRRKLGK
ncbi:hypothetical protein N0V90_007961 [Kalmusia sp. IMI 367209]|nr:hypothetical protein N0V90_007961 [Kalmusia sp. IMI 367209]